MLEAERRKPSGFDGDMFDVGSIAKALGLVVPEGSRPSASGYCPLSPLSSASTPFEPPTSCASNVYMIALSNDSSSNS